MLLVVISGLVLNDHHLILLLHYNPYNIFTYRVTNYGTYLSNLTEINMFTTSLKPNKSEMHIEIEHGKQLLQQVYLPCQQVFQLREQMILLEKLFL